ncbi:MAG: hypothetical protein AAF196_08870 [Planctomycetota bacterium]
MIARPRLHPTVASSAATWGTTLVLTLASVRAQETGPESRPSLDEMKILAAALDTAFQERETATFLASFDTIHVGHQETIRERLDSTFKYGIDCTRESVVLDHWPVGNHTIAHVESVVRTIGFKAETVEHYLLAARHRPEEGGRTAQITLLLQIADELLPGISRPSAATDFSSRFQCPVCNFDVECGDNWLAAPVCHERYGGVEAISFHSLDQDVKVFVSVHLRDEAIDPQEHLSSLERFQEPPEVTPWRPTYFTETDAPRQLSAARARFSLDQTKRRNEAYFVAYGRVGYLLEVEGAAAAVNEQMGEVERLLSSFRLVNNQLAPEQVASAIMTYRRAGKVTASNLYVNEGLGVSIQGPNEWSAELETGGLVFDLRFRHPTERCFVSARGLAPQRGRDRWSTEMADSMTSRLLMDGELEVLEQTDWVEREDARTRDCRMRNGEGRLIALRLALRDDLLIVLEGHCDDPEQVPDLIEIFDSLNY